VPGVRLQKKQQTRERVIAAARDLFVEVGYEAATIRQIAQRAGVAVGSVFTTFASKLEILHFVMIERLDRLYAELDSVTPHLRGSTTDRLCSIMAVHYDFEMKRPRLFTAYLAANFEWSETPVVTYGANPKLRGMLGDVLTRGITVGEVRPDAEIELFLDLMLASYAMNYRLAAQQGLAAPALIEAMDRQIALAFRGIAL
jgi:AcrR family transcriptional regulator